MTADEIRAICDEGASHPGRLQGMTAADVYWTLVNDDLWDSCYNVTPDEVEIFPELAGVGAVNCYTDDAGFCYVSRHESIEAADDENRISIDEVE